MSKKYYERELLEEIKKWVSRREVIAIKGPRQAGKTTLLEMLANWLVKERGVKEDDITFLTFEDLEDLDKFVKDPKAFIKSFIKGNKRHYFFIDEFHYARDGGKKLKFLYDTLENVKFILTGSSSLEIAEFSKQMVGRVFSFQLLPFSFGEFLNVKDKRLSEIYKEKNFLVKDFILNGKGFGIKRVKREIFADDLLKFFEEYAVFGGYPEVVKARDPETRRIVLKNIYETYITKDIIGLLRIHDALKFKRFVSLLASQHGGIINYNELALSSGSYYKGVVDSLGILEETYVIKLLRPFHKNLKTEIKKNPKVYFLDPGLRNYSLPDFNAMERRPDKGVLAEGAVLNSLLRLPLEPGRTSYWRTLSKAEVDFILVNGNAIIPIEVKFSPFKKPSVSRSFRSFIEAYSPERALVVTRDFWGEKQILRTDIKFVRICYL